MGMVGKMAAVASGVCHLATLCVILDMQVGLRAPHRRLLDEARLAGLEREHAEMKASLKALEDGSNKGANASSTQKNLCIPFTFDLADESMDKLVGVLDFKDADARNDLEEARKVRHADVQEEIKSYSSTIAKERLTAQVHRKYDFCLTCSDFAGEKAGGGAKAADVEVDATAAAGGDGEGADATPATTSTALGKKAGKTAEHAAHAMLLDTHLKEDVNIGHLHSKRGDVGGSQFLANNRTNTVKLFGTRVVPVYLLSLASYGKGVTLDEDDGLDVSENDDITDDDDDDYIRNDVASDESLVVVLQDASEIASQDAAMDGSGNSAPSRKGIPNPNPTRDIIAGLAKTLGALPLPFEARKHKGRDFEPLLWAVGCHPFGGDLSNTEDVSEVIANAGRRNHIVSRLDSAIHIVEAATETYNAFASEYVNESDDYEKYHDALPHSLPKRIAKEMRENLRDMNDAFEELAKTLSSFEENEDAVHEQSDFVLSKAMEFAERSRLTIENAMIKLARCRLRREKMSVTNSILMFPVFLENVFSGEHVFFALAILAIVIFAISTGKRKRRKYPRNQQQNFGHVNRAAINRAQVTSF